MHPAANCDEICRAKSPVKMSGMVQRLSDRACGFGVVAHLRRAIEVNRPYLRQTVRPPLFRRAGVGVCFDIAPLFVNYATQFPLHRFESVMDNLIERLVRAVVLLLFIGHEFVTARNGYVDATTVRVSLLVGVIGLLDGHIAAVNVVAKFFQPRRVIQNEIVDLVRFFQAAIGDLNRQLHIT